MNKKTTQLLPKIRGKKWLDAQIPSVGGYWLEGNRGAIRRRKSSHSKTRLAIQKVVATHTWNFPKKQVIFISDVHADAHAFLQSLIACGAIKKTGAEDCDLKLTSCGKKSRFILGGDFLEKGPSNLRLLRAVAHFMATGADVRILAGNHDIRVLFGMRSLGNTDDPRNGHFFARMGAKCIPFLREIYQEYLQEGDSLAHIPDKETCKKRMFPTEKWHKNFPTLASWVMTQPAIERELAKIKHKVETFEENCKKNGLSLREAYAAALKWQELFLDTGGEFHWFYDKMRLAEKKGSFLFVHAGLDDRTAAMIKKHGTSFLNKLFRLYLDGSPFEFYYGPVANIVRTKYRSVDMPLSAIGHRDAHAAGIRAIIHGHRSLSRGQRIAIRRDLLHFECDITLDSESRKNERLKGVGAGATIIHPKGYIFGISSDCDQIKVFDPKSIKKSTLQRGTAKTCTQPSKNTEREHHA